jgi:hypothetical protein
MGSASCAWTPDRHEVSLFADRALAKSDTRPHHSGGGRLNFVVTEFSEVRHREMLPGTQRWPTWQIRPTSRTLPSTPYNVTPGGGLCTPFLSSVSRSLVVRTAASL